MLGVHLVHVVTFHVIKFFHLVVAISHHGSVVGTCHVLLHFHTILHNICLIIGVLVLDTIRFVFSFVITVANVFL